MQAAWRPYTGLPSVAFAHLSTSPQMCSAHQSCAVNLRRDGSLVFLVFSLLPPAESLVLCSCHCWLIPLLIPHTCQKPTDASKQCKKKKLNSPASLPSFTLSHTICSLFSPWLVAPGASGCQIPCLSLEMPTWFRWCHVPSLPLFPWQP